MLGVFKADFGDQGSEHYLWSVVQRGQVRPKYSLFFDEGYYLSAYPDVAQAVRNKVFSKWVRSLYGLWYG